MGSLARAKQEKTHTRAGGKSEQRIRRTYVESSSEQGGEGREAFLPQLSRVYKPSPLLFFAMYTMLANNISAAYLTPTFFSLTCPRVYSAFGLTKHILNLST